METQPPFAQQLIANWSCVPAASPFVLSAEDDLPVCLRLNRSRDVGVGEPPLSIKLSVGACGNQRLLCVVYDFGQFRKWLRYVDVAKLVNFGESDVCID